MEIRKRRIRVLVADDSPAALRSVCKYLKFETDFEIAGTARDGQHLLQQAEHLHPDLVLVDLSMPKMNGLEAVTELRKAYPGMRVLIFSQLSGLSLREECLRSGADGFVEKSLMPEKLMEEVRKLFPEESPLE
ncbi:MAG TPA: response regulator transcription factor [Candidatus Cybelea sp.]|nr:response regulator transcription factor [Candidatus Cybelea sp.]